MGGFFNVWGCFMDIYIYSDESGVFDYEHNRYFVFGGVVFLNIQDRDNAARKYLHAERVVRSAEKLSRDSEVKATAISNKNKGKLLRSLNNIYKFGIVVNQKVLNKNIFDNKKSKQRYLDYAFKIGVKRFFEDLINQGIIVPSEVNNMFFFVDTHTTATDGRYELRSALEQEFKIGTFNYCWSHFFPPIFPQLKQLDLKLCNSKKITLVRAADIVANRLFYEVTTGLSDFENKDNVHVTHLPN